MHRRKFLSFLGIGAAAAPVVAKAAVDVHPVVTAFDLPVLDLPGPSPNPPWAVGTIQYGFATPHGGLSFNLTTSGAGAHTHSISIARIWDGKEWHDLYSPQGIAVHNRLLRANS